MKIDIFQNLGLNCLKKASTKTHNLFYKFIFVIQQSKKQSLWELLYSTNQYQTKFHIPYHFPQFLLLVFKTRLMRQCQIQVAFADTFCLFCPQIMWIYTSDIYKLEVQLVKSLFANRCCQHRSILFSQETSKICPQSQPMHSLI